MTFRPPATKPQRRRSQQSGARRTLLLNIAFGIATVASVALLAGVLLGNYYTDHWVPVSSVNGAAISKDAVRDRAAVNQARYERQIENFQTMRNQGAITSDEYSSIASGLTSHQDPKTLYDEALSQLQGDLVVTQYADKNGIRIADSDVDAQIAKDATLEEMRHVKIIGVDAKATPPATVPTASEIAAARAQADKYLADLKNAKTWDDVYAASTADGSVGAEGTNTGDLGLVTRDTLSLDPALADAVFAMANEGEYTAVFASEDGIFRIATVTKIMTSYKDPGWVDSVGRSSSGDAYRSAARAEAVREAVRATIEAKYVSGASVARSVKEIAVSPGFGGSGDEYKLKIMIFAPNHSVSDASSVATDDPAWAAAKKRADQAYADLQKDPTKFATLAKDTTNNDDQMFAAQSGDVPWLSADVIYDGGQGGTTINMPSLRTAVSAEGVTPGLLAPIQEPSMGYVVAILQGSRPSPATRVATAQLLMAMGSLSFDQAVATYSESSDATKGGDMGWIFRYLLPPEMEQAIFSTPVGSVSRTVQNSSGLWVFKVVAEETRTPDALGQAKLKMSAWKAWLTEQTSAANVWTDTAAMTAITPVAAQ
jgi:parvulin-like peptidyl-prolyl isomerase